MAAQAQRSATNAVALQRQNLANQTAMRGRGRPVTITKTSPAGTVMRNNIQTQPQHLGNRAMPGLSMQNSSYPMHATGQFNQVIFLSCFYIWKLLILYFYDYSPPDQSPLKTRSNPAYRSRRCPDNPPLRPLSRWPICRQLRLLQPPRLLCPPQNHRMLQTWNLVKRHRLVPSRRLSFAKFAMDTLRIWINCAITCNGCTRLR